VWQICTTWPKRDYLQDTTAPRYRDHSMTSRSIARLIRIDGHRCPTLHRLWRISPEATACRCVASRRFTSFYSFLLRPRRMIAVRRPLDRKGRSLLKKVWCCRSFYLTSHHQSANPAVPTTAVMAVEISNESAASLIQSVTALHFQSAALPRWWTAKPQTLPTGLLWWPTNRCILHPLGLLGPSISVVGPCLAVVWLAVGAAPSLLRPSLLSRWCWLVIGLVARWMMGRWSKITASNWLSDHLANCGI